MNAMRDEPISPFSSSIVAIRLALAHRADRLCRQLSRSSPDQVMISTDSFSRQLSPTPNSGSSIWTGLPASGRKPATDRLDLGHSLPLPGRRPYSVA
jgi:hypothetical protein